MPQRPIGVADEASAASVTEYRARERALSTFSDSFNRPDGPVGGNWATAGTGPMTIGANQIVGGSSTSALRWTQAPGAGTQYSQATYVGSGVFIGVAVAIPGYANGTALASVEPFYVFRQLGSTGGIMLGQKDAGAATFTTLAADTTRNLAAGEIIRVEFDGTTLRGFINGAQVLSAAPTTPLTGRGVGVAHGSSTQAGVALLDDWTGGAFPDLPVVEQYLILQRERVRSFVGMAASFRTASSPTHTGSIWNAAGSGVLVAVLKVTAWKVATSNSSSVALPRFGRTTTEPTGGVLLDKVSVGTGVDVAEASSVSVAVRSAATADGTGTALTVTETTRVASLGQPGRLASAAFEHSPLNLGWPVDSASLSGTHELMDGMDPFSMVILRGGEGLVGFVETTSSVQQAGMNVLWEEYALP